MQVIAVPVKALERAKSRLAPALAPAERAALTMAMLEDVLDACLDQDGWQTWVISTPGAALDLAAARGARPVSERGASLSEAVLQVGSELGARPAGSARVEGGSARVDSGSPHLQGQIEHSALAIVLADLPLITRTAIAGLLSHARP